MDRNSESNLNNNLDPPAEPNRIVTFRDGLGLAMQLADEYAFMDAAVLLDGAGTVVDLITASGIGRPIGSLIGRACATLGRIDRNGHSPGPGLHPAEPGLRPAEPGPHQAERVPDQHPGPISVLVISVRPFEQDVIREADLTLFRRARWAIGVAGAEVVDWIETDGDLFRSYAYVTCPALAWPNDPPGERLDRAWTVW